MNREKALFSRRRVWAAPHNWTFVAIALLGGLFLTSAAGVLASAQNAAGSKSVWDGVYTAAQATRGKKLFSETCQDCHMEDLQGDTADIPALAGDLFLDAWMNKSVDELFTRMRATMPQDSPSSLPVQTYVDIVAYILQVNKLPAGKVELKRDADLMKAMMITKTK
jgi:quinoprotein glucose dehydrogenase